MHTSAFVQKVIDINTGFCKYPDTEQLRNISKYIYQPTIFTGTIKLDGTNAGICYNKNKGFWYQSRNRVLTLDNDNYDFMAFATGRKAVWQAIVDTIELAEEETLCIFGEYCGKDIGRNTAIQKLPRFFVLFQVDIRCKSETRYLSISDLKKIPVDNSQRVYNIYQFPTYEITIDPARLENADRELLQYLTPVCEQCPVGNQLGVTGRGEGLVWSTETKNLKFKTVGRILSVSKSTQFSKVADVHTEAKFVNYACTENRMKQGLQLTKLQAEFVNWVLNDIHKEESDVVEANDLEWEDIRERVTNKANRWYTYVTKI